MTQRGIAQHELLVKYYSSGHVNTDRKRLTRYCRTAVVSGHDLTRLRSGTLPLSPDVPARRTAGRCSTILRQGPAMLRWGDSDSKRGVPCHPLLSLGLKVPGIVCFRNKTSRDKYMREGGIFVFTNPGGECTWGGTPKNEAVHIPYNDNKH